MWTDQPTEVTRTPVPMPRLRKPVRVALLSDLHYGLYTGQRTIRGWCDLAMAEDPDLVVIAGDLVDRYSLAALAPLLRALETLQAPLGTFACWGNHDRTNRRHRGHLERALREVDIRMLSNEGVRVTATLSLAAIDDLREGNADVRRALAKRPRNSDCLLLSHNPDALPFVPADVDLTLCGHTHGGQVRLPLYGPVVTSSEYGRRFASGTIVEPVRAYVTRGLGVTVLPFRFRCPPEVAILDLVPVRTEQADRSGYRSRSSRNA